MREEQTKEEIIEEFSCMGYPELGSAIKTLQAEKKVLKDQIGRLERKYDTITIEIVPDKLAEDGLRGAPLADGSRIQLSTQAYCSTRAGMKQALFDWMIAHDFEELITEVVNPSTLKAFIKEQREAGNETPDDTIVNYQPYSRATVVK